ncbi:MAG: MATE family efflux transporter [Sandaracinaceae bacterium]
MTPLRAVWEVAWPMAALGVLRSLYYLTDSFWVGRLGADALAAIGGSAFAWWIVFLMAELPATGAHALVAQHEGAERRDRIGPVVGRALTVGAFVAAALAALSAWVPDLYFSLLGLDGSAATHGAAYVGAALLGAGSLVVYAVVGAAFRGLGQTRVALGLTAATLLVNALLDPLLIWGFGPVPALGIAGAAWATALANLVGAGLGIWLLKRAGTPVETGAPPGTAWRILQIGLPVTASGVGFALVYVVLGRMITAHGEAQMAALGVGHRIESIPYFIGVAFGVGAATMVGQHLGASDPKSAEQSIRAAAKLALCTMVPFGALLFGAAAPLFALFTDDPATVEAGVLYLRVQVVVFAFMALEETYRGAFVGAGQTTAAAVIEFVWTLARVPAAWLLAEAGLGIVGVWVAVAASTAIKGVSLVIWWKLRGPTRLSRGCQGRR